VASRSLVRATWRGTSQNSQLKACLRNPQPQNSATFTYEICSHVRKEVARVDHLGLPVICVETRHMRAVLKAQINKTGP
jgi:hypothetical protein